MYVGFSHLDPFFKQSIGIDDMIREIERFNKEEIVPASKYPPHSILELEPNKFLVELAVAGFSQDELSVIVEDGILKISGNKQPDSREYRYKGISTKSFTKTIKLIDTVEVQKAELTNGILSVYMENIIPENKKPKAIPINTDKGLLLESK